ncbi:MAG: MopE-related protein, partial [Polyangiales bacterium]
MDRRRAQSATRAGLRGGRVAAWLRGLCAAVLWLVASEGRLHAQIKPRFVIAVDTSGSMLYDLSNRTTYGDGVGRIATGTDNQALVRDGIFYGCGTTAGLDRDCDGLPNDSKLFKAKSAIRKMVLGFGDVEWSLARFHQNVANATGQYEGSNSCGSGAIVYGNPQCNTDDTAGGCVADVPIACRPGQGSNLPLREYRTNDYIARIPFSGTCDNGDLLVGFPGSGAFASLDNRPAILKWIDNVERGFDGSTTAGNHCNHAGNSDCELRANGGTPLGGLILASGNYITTTRTADTSAACRQYSVILLTDGAETCDSNPNRRAFELAYPGNGTTCTPTALPSSTPQVRTYVVGLSIGTSDRTSLNAIAACGGTTQAYFADTETALSAALADIVSRSILVETCNGKDDDCDTRVDEGIPTGQPGKTAQPGALFCDREARRTDAQNVQVRARPDIADNFARTTAVNSAIVCGRVDDTCSRPGSDDDCDGKLDEDATNLTSCGTCPGVTDACDGIDNDCDQIIDEGTGGGKPFSACPTTCTRDVPCGSGVGTCRLGAYKCTGGILDTSACMGQVGPTTEVCDNLDNDCNGIVDDPNVLQRACTPSWGMTGICVPGTQFCAKMGEAADDSGYAVDSNGRPICKGQVGPSDRELCDSLDHDCDGNPFTCTQPGCVSPVPVGVGDPCGQGVGSCVGTQYCDMTANPPTLRCDAAGGSDEICDGLDNDCDGAVDEGLPPGGPCGSSAGECKPGTLVCNASGGQDCVGGTEPTPEVCDSLDNDCDGKLDEGLALGEDCGSDVGECNFGKNTCVSGRIVCTGEAGPGRETCDCLDNDCDGVVDEGTGDDPVCPGGSSCTMCQCALPCAPSVEFVAACPNGKAAVTDDNGCFCVAERCNDRSCGSQTLSVNDEVQCQPLSTRVAACSCKNNECTFACAGVLCADGLVCDPTDGRCRQASCLLPQFPCPDGQRCGLADGVFECTADACAGVTCGGDDACRDGSCVKSCARVTCNDGQVCRDGACEDNRCNGVSCGADQVCDVSNGDCVERAACAVSGCP